MTTPLTFRMTIPLHEEYQWERSPIFFTRWLPTSPQDSLHLRDGDLELTFWLDTECLGIARPSPSDIPSYVNLDIVKLYVEITGIAVADDLALLFTRISGETNWTPEHIDVTYPRSAVQEYNQIAERVYVAGVRHFNRLVAFLRATKGQYWLQEYKPMLSLLASELNRFGAKAKVGAGEWIRLASTRIDNIRSMALAEEKLISREDWPKVQSFLASEGRPPFVGLLLASAEEFGSLGHRRAALTEAVSALEIAVSQFTGDDTAQWATSLQERTEVADLSTHIEHLGFTCTVAYLFPLIFTENQMPNDVLRNCRDAIRERQNVVHRGQKDVDESKLRKYLSSLRQCCQRLHDLRASPEPVRGS